ncbi:MAG TPA: hypothetical protein VG188_10070 [Solirubrobacteraceae bacterium]|nr:hypothetical protein [Solirubrobacteraceae bacterium]
MSPIVTVGLPAPGVLADPLAVDDEDELDDELLPHAANPALSAATAISAVTLPPTLLDLLKRAPGIYASSCC